VREAYVICDEEVRAVRLAYRENSSKYVASFNLLQMGALRLQMGWLKRQIQKLASTPATALVPCIYGAPPRAPPAPAAHRPRTPTKLTIEALDRLVGSGMGVMLGVAPFGGAMLGIAPFGGALLPRIHSPRTSQADAAAALSATDRGRIDEMTKLAGSGSGSGSARQLVGSARSQSGSARSLSGSARSYSARAAVRDLSVRDRSPARLQRVDEDEVALERSAVPGGAGAVASSSEALHGLRQVEAKLGDEEARLALLNEKLASLLR
jgi:hypothetical protein